MQTNSNGFILCPKCAGKTKTKVIPGTKLVRFPLYCTWCKRETVIDFEFPTVSAGDDII